MNFKLLEAVGGSRWQPNKGNKIHANIMGLGFLILVGLSLSPYEFFHALIFHRKKEKLLEEFLINGVTLEAIIHSNKNTQRRYGRFQQVHSTIQYSYTLASGETYYKNVTLKSSIVPKSAATLAIKVLPKQYPESACPVLFLKEQQRDLSSKCNVSIRLVFALLGMSIAALVLHIVVRAILIRSEHYYTPSKLRFWSSYMIVLVLYIVSGYPCALCEFRRWKRFLLQMDDSLPPNTTDEALSTRRVAEYQLVKQPDSRNNKTTNNDSLVRVQEVTSHSLSLDIGEELDCTGEDGCRLSQPSTGGVMPEFLPL